MHSVTFSLAGQRLSCVYKTLPLMLSEYHIHLWPSCSNFPLVLLWCSLHCELSSKKLFCHCWRILAKLGKLGRKLQKGREMMWDVRPHAARRPWVIFYTSIDLRQCLLGDFTEVLFLQLVHLIAPQRKIRLWSGSERSLKLPIWLKSWSYPQKVFQVLSMCDMHQAASLVHSRPACSL